VPQEEACQQMYNTHIHTHMRTHTNTHIHTHAHTQHTHAHTHTHTCLPDFVSLAAAHRNPVTAKRQSRLESEMLCMQLHVQKWRKLRVSQSLSQGSISSCICSIMYRNALYICSFIYRNTLYAASCPKFTAD